MSANNVTYRIYIEKIGGRQVTDFIGLPGELFYDPGRGELRLSDGSTPGGRSTSVSAEVTDIIARTVAALAFEKSNSVAQNAFVSINVAGQNNIVSTSNTSILRIRAGVGVSVTTDPTNTTLTITTTANDTYARTHVNSAFNLANTRGQNVFSIIAVEDKGNVTAATNADSVILSPGAGIDMSGSDNTIIIRSSINSFSTIAVSGQNNVVADANADTLTLATGNGISITTDPANATLTISAANTIDQFARDHANGAFAALNTGPMIVAHSAVSTLAANVNTAQSLVTVTVPGGLLGPNGWVQCVSLWTMDASASAKDLSIRTLSSTGTRLTNLSATNQISLYMVGDIHNRGNVNSQISGPVSQFYYGAVSSEGGFSHTINTDNDWEIHFAVTKTVATERVTLEQYSVIAQYGA